MENQVLSDDMLVGSQAIAEYIGEDPRKTFYLLQKKQLPAFKLPGSSIWRARKSALQRHIERLEQGGGR
jgi:hypothetical protein